MIPKNAKNDNCTINISAADHNNWRKKARTTDVFKDKLTPILSHFDTYKIIALIKNLINKPSKIIIKNARAKDSSINKLSVYNN